MGPIPIRVQFHTDFNVYLLRSENFLLVLIEFSLFFSFFLGGGGVEYC